MTPEAGRRPARRVWWLVAGLLALGVLAAGVLLRPGGGLEAGLLYVGDAELSLRDLETGEQRGYGVRPSDFHAAPDGRSVAWDEEGSLVRLDLGSGAVERTPVPDGFRRFSGFAPDGRLVLVRTTGAGREILVAMDDDGGEQILVPLGFGGIAWGPVWIDGTTLAVTLQDREGEGEALYILDLSSGEPSTVHIIPEAYPHAASPEGGRLIYSRTIGPNDPGTPHGLPEAGIEILHVDQLESEDTGLTGYLAGAPDAALYSAQGTAALRIDVYYGDHGLWVLAGGEPRRVLPTLATAMAWAPDGRLLFVVGGRVHAASAPEWQPEDLGIRVHANRIVVVP